MTRHALRITILLGALITLLGGTGIFAVFSDRATAGGNSVTSGVRPRAADLRIEAASYSAETGVDCDGNRDGLLFEEDDTSTAQFVAVSMQPDSALADAFLCLKNIGSASLSVTASAINLVDLDVECTGDEATAGDTTCGKDATETPGQGELAALLTVELERVVCSDGRMAFGSNRGPVALPDFLSQPVAGGTDPALGPDQEACIRVQLRYPAVGEALAQVAQSDKVLWRFAFDATAQ